MHQGRGLERLPGCLLGHFLGCQLAEFVIDERQQLCGGVGVTRPHRGKDASHVAHDVDDIRVHSELQGRAW